MVDLLIESKIRAKAFEFLQVSVDRYGEVLPWEILTKGFSFEGTTVPLIGASGIWKPRILRSIPIGITTAPPNPYRPAP